MKHARLGKVNFFIWMICRPDLSSINPVPPAYVDYFLSSTDSTCISLSPLLYTCFNFIVIIIIIGIRFSVCGPCMCVFVRVNPWYMQKSEHSMK